MSGCWLVAGALVSALGAAWLKERRALPSLEGRSISTAASDTDDTRLGRAIVPRVRVRPGLSGVFPLADAREAYAARAHLASAADRTLDVQYYIWENDLTGALMANALRAAAERGVRVRLLLDDNNTAGLDPLLAVLNAHPGIEVRLFNPFTVRRPRALGYLVDFFRLNRRMHNKSFTADNQATIIGGRNIGDEYFGAAEGRLMVDLDVLAVGPVVGEVSSQFDAYWASGSAYPADRLLPPMAPARAAEIAAAARRVEESPDASAYRAAVQTLPFVRALVDGTLALEWAPTRMIADDPAKGLGRAASKSYITAKLRETLGRPAVRLEMISPYFVPTNAVVDWLTALVREGVDVRVFTNALEATDVAVVHSGYAKWRKALLRAGVTIFEMRRLSPRSPRAGRTGVSLSSRSSLHAKTFAVDGARLFIGSFNFDPRSARLNTEMGFVIESPAMAGKIDAAFSEAIPATAYEARLTDGGLLYWLERSDGKVLRHDTEPGAGFWRRAGVCLLALLPIDALL